MAASLLNLAILLFLVSGIETSPTGVEKEHYENGIAYKNAGDWQTALNVWLVGYRTLQKEGKVDPRIATAFIELATEQSALLKYQDACEIYYWGFSSPVEARFRQQMAEEVKRISPILPKRLADDWKSLWNRNDTSLPAKVVSFWHQKDPTPSTRYNERLIEHWSRIAYARKNFHKANSTVYGTDDRALIYVKYGKPDRISAGILGTNRSALKRWSDVILDSDNDTGSGGGNFGAGQRAIEQTLLLEGIERFNYFPEYELWFYSIFADDEPVFFLFGNREGLSSFGLRTGVEELIPSNSFLNANRKYGSGISPGSVLQALYYGELTHLHSYFERRFLELEDVWGTYQLRGASATSHTNSILRLKRQQFSVLDKTDPVYRVAPLDRSDFGDTVSSVRLAVQPFRFLDDKDKPMLGLVTFSYPEIKSTFFDKTKNELIPNYTMTHTLIVKDGKEEELSRLSDTVPPGSTNLTTFILAHRNNQSDYEIYAEVFSSTPSSQPPAAAIGVGRTRTTVSAPLSSDKEHLELSDLIIGVNSPEDSDLKRLPFPVVPSHSILKTDVLSIYLEIYHAYLDQDGMAHLAIDVGATKLEGKKKRKAESITLSFNIDSQQRTSKEILNIDISRLSAGTYELLVQVSDKVWPQQKQRIAEFKIIENRFGQLR